MFTEDGRLNQRFGLFTVVVFLAGALVVLDQGALKKLNVRPRMQTHQKTKSIPCGYWWDSQTYRIKSYGSSNYNKSLPLCPLLSKGTGRPILVNMTVPKREDLERKHPDLDVGGRWTPPGCVPRFRVAIVIPYRDRRSHLLIFAQHMHVFLQQQLIAYGIYVIEEALPTKFNRAMLMNIGFIEANKMYDYDCVVFHDVDLLPEVLGNLYSCPDQPRHMSAAIDKMNYKLPYTTIFGGTVAFRNDHFRLINGFSNLFFGWGGEDDDLYNRVRKSGLSVYRFPMSIARYKMIKHKRDAGNNPNPVRMALLRHGPKRFATDGLNSLNYTIISVNQTKLYTMIYVKFPEIQPPKEIFPKPVKKTPRKRDKSKWNKGSYTTRSIKTNPETKDKLNPSLEGKR